MSQSVHLEKVQRHEAEEGALIECGQDEEPIEQALDSSCRHPGPWWQGNGGVAVFRTGLSERHTDIGGDEREKRKQHSHDPEQQPREKKRSKTTSPPQPRSASPAKDDGAKDDGGAGGRRESKELEAKELEERAKRKTMTEEVILYGTKESVVRVIKASSNEMHKRKIEAVEGGLCPGQRGEMMTLLEMIPLDRRPYDPAKHGGLMPWELPGFASGDQDRKDDADGRKTLKNWCDYHVLWVHECRVPLKLAINEHFQHLAAYSGILGPVVLERFLDERNCGDTVSLPVDPTILAKVGLSDPRASIGAAVPAVRPSTMNQHSA